MLRIDELHMPPFGVFRIGNEYMSMVLMTPECQAMYEEFLKRMVCVSEVIVSGPATVVKFSDGTKVVSKAHDGDKPDPVFGLVWCCLRKAMRNRTCDHIEKVVRRVVKRCRPEDMRALGKALVMAADWLEG